MKFLLTAILMLCWGSFIGAPMSSEYESGGPHPGDVEILAKLINSEAKWEPMLGQIAVANVAINRARRRGKSLSYIVHEKGQFDGVRTKHFIVTPRAQQAAEIALRNSVIPKEVEFFHNPRTSTDSKWVRYIEKHKFRQIGNHLFCFNPRL